MRQYNFKSGLAAVLATCVLVPLFCSLGFWQLDRAKQKQSLQLQLAARNTLPAVDNVSISDIEIETLRYRKARLQGTLDIDHNFILDNQLHNGHAGYHVLTPLHLSGSDKTILVNRGWLPAGPDRSVVPDIQLSQRWMTEPVWLEGQIDAFYRVGLKLQGAETPSAGWPAMVQVLESAALSERLGYVVLPMQLLLDAQNVSLGFQRDWQQPAAKLNPDTNRGYAFQWFAFAVFTIGLFFWYGFRPVRSSLPSSQEKFDPYDK